MKSLVKFTPKKSKIVKDGEDLTIKRDMRKKSIKSNTTWPDIKKRIIKHDFGGTFIDYQISEPPYEPVSEDFNPELYFSHVKRSNDLDINSDSNLEIVPYFNSNLDSDVTLGLTSNLKSESNLTPNFHDNSSAKLNEKFNRHLFSLYGGSKVSSKFNPQYGLMKQFVDLAKEENIPIRITSAYRPGAITSNGSPSWHSKGLALDITPAKGVSWNELKLAFKNSPRTLQWLKDNDFGILDETTPEMLAKTGGTGAHWHIGRDRAANRAFFKKGGMLDLNKLFFKPKEYVKDDKPSYLDYFNQFISKPMSSNYNTKFETKDFNKFATTMKSIYEEVLQELGLPTHNLKNLVRQDALESNYGLNAKNYNLGGIKYRDSDGSYKLKDFNNLKEYAMYKVKLLDKYYDAIKTPENNFIAALHGNNKDNRHYNDNIEMYKAINYMKSLDKYL